MNSLVTHLVLLSPTDHKSIDVFHTRVLGNGNLLISDVRLQHSGVYVCRATIPGTRNFTVAMATLTVLGEPLPAQWEHPVSVLLSPAACWTGGLSQTSCARAVGRLQRLNGSQNCGCVLLAVDLDGKCQILQV